MVKYIAPAPAVTAAFGPAVEYTATAHAVFAAPAPEVDCIAPATAGITTSVPYLLASYHSACAACGVHHVAVLAPVMEGITPAHGVVAAPSLVVEYTTPTYVVTAARAPVVEFIAPALPVFATPALVVEHITPAPAKAVDENVAPAPAVLKSPVPVVRYIEPAPAVPDLPALVLEDHRIGGTASLQHRLRNRKPIRHAVLRGRNGVRFDLPACTDATRGSDRFRGSALTTRPRPDLASWILSALRSDGRNNLPDDLPPWV